MKRWLFVLLVLAGCRPDDQRTGSVEQENVRKARTSLPQAFVTQLDSGNAAYRAKDYSRAVAHYRAAIRVDDEQPSAWFGIYMAERAAGNTAEAEAALERAQKLAPGASLIHPPSESKDTSQ